MEARYKRCGHSHPYYTQEGEYDEVNCDLMKDLCGDVPCPLDLSDNAERIVDAAVERDYAKAVDLEMNNEEHRRLYR